MTPSLSCLRTRTNGSYLRSSCSIVAPLHGPLPFSPRTLFHQNDREDARRSPATNSPNASTAHTPAMVQTERSVNVAVVANASITAVKAIACAFTGSAVMFSEALHSLGDTANQILLFIGMRKGKQKPDHSHPYGYGREPYIYALMSAMGVLFIGSGAAVYHGTSLLVSPEPHVVDSYALAFSVLGISGMLEATSFYQALKAVRMCAREKGVGVYRFLSDGGSDPWGIAILMEDGVGLLGITVAASTLSLAYYTGNTAYDAVGSLVVGGLLGVSALFLIDKNRRVLLGGAISPELQVKRQKITDILKSDPAIQSVTDVKVEMTGPTGGFRFKAEVRWNGQHIARTCLENRCASTRAYPPTTTGNESRADGGNDDLHDEALRLLEPSITLCEASPAQLRNYLHDFGSDVVDTLAMEVDRVERRIRAEVPDARHIDLENDR